MNILHASMPVGVLAVVIVAYTLLLIASFYGWWKAEQECKRTRVAYWKERDGKIKAQDALDKARAQCAVTAQAFTELDSLHQKVVAERDKWQGLYGELVNTLHAAQGDTHATAPLQEVAPEPVKRTRKPKAETKQ